MEATFRVSVKEFSTKQLVSLDQSSRVTLEIDNMPTDIKNKINSIQDNASNKSGEVICTLKVAE